MQQHESLQRLLNLTPHDVVVYDQDGCTVLRRYERSGVTCFVTEADQYVECGGSERIIDGIRVLRPPVQTGLSYVPPDQHTDVIVSQITAQYIVTHWEKYKNNFGRIFVPATSMAMSVRDGKGQIVGTKALIEYYTHRF